MGQIEQVDKTMIIQVVSAPIGPIVAHLGWATSSSFATYNRVVVLSVRTTRPVDDALPNCPDNGDVTIFAVNAASTRTED